MTSPRVTVIVPVKDDAFRLGKCLEALSNQTYDQPYEIIVGDNGSSDHPEDVVARYPLARLLHEPENGSYAARNAALAEASGEILAFTDADCIPDEEWLANGVKHLEEAGENSYIGGRVKLFPGREGKPTAAEAWEMCQGFPQQEFIERQNFSATANLFAWRSAFDRAGAFQQTFISSGDREWGNRATANGIKGMYRSDVVVAHPCRGSLKALRVKGARMLTGDMQLRRKEQRPLITARELAIAVAPPIPTLLRNLPKVDPPNLRTRCAFTVGLFYLTYTNLVDRLRTIRAERKRSES